MDRLKKFEKSNIEKVLRDNFSKLMPTFYEMESSFLSGVYKRYGDFEGGNIVIYFARDLHLEILRKRENDLSFDLSLDMFWQKHKDIRQGKKNIIVVSKETGLPVHIAEDPLACVAIGTGKALDQEETFSSMLTEY